MMKIPIYFCFLVIFLIVKCETKVHLVNVVFRHGDRTPSAGNEMYPKDPYNDESFSPIGRGGLTNQGKRREFKLGQVLRERYTDFLGSAYTPDILRARSTNYDRTKMSLQLVLASLFPPPEFQKWNDNLNWQPIPYTYLSEDLDNLLIPEECPQYLNEIRKLLLSAEMKENMTNYFQFMHTMTRYTGKDIHNPYDMYNLYLGLIAEEAMNLTLPSWTQEISFPKGKLLEGTLLYYNMFSKDTKLKRLNGGMLVRQILENIDNLLNSTSENPKLYLYSGHETNIAALLQALKVYEPHVPEFSSAVIVEFGEDKLTETNYFYVQILYYTGIPSKLVPLKLPGCSEKCPLDKFRDLLWDVVPSDEERECDKVHRPFNLDSIYKHFGSFVHDINQVIHV